MTWEFKVLRVPRVPTPINYKIRSHALRAKELGLPVRVPPPIYPQPTSLPRVNDIVTHSTLNRIIEKFQREGPQSSPNQLSVFVFNSGESSIYSLNALHGWLRITIGWFPRQDMEDMAALAAERASLAREFHIKEPIMPHSEPIMPHSEFITAFNLLQHDIHKNSVNHGFWETPRSDGECIALMHSELSEALEALRLDNDNYNDNNNNNDNVTVELADCVIRIMDYCEANHLPLAKAILDKHKFNKTRPYKHGKKF